MELTFVSIIFSESYLCNQVVVVIIIRLKLYYGCTDGQTKVLSWRKNKEKSKVSS